VSANTETKRTSVAVLLSGREKFSPYFGGAIARWTYEVYRRLSDQFDVTVFGHPTEKKDIYPLRHESDGVWRLCDCVAKILLLRRYEETIWLRALMRRLRGYDMVHIHNRPQWVRTLRKLGYAGAIMLHLHNDHLGHWSAAALDALATEVNAVAVCSGYLGSTFMSGSPALSVKTRVVFNGANLELFSPREEFREPKTIFFVGRVEPLKGVLQLLQAYEKVLDTHSDAKLVIGGSSGFGTHMKSGYVRQVRALAEMLTEKRHAQIQFTGYLDHDRELPRWFQKAAIFVCPSLVRETFGLVNAEAMACATTVVASNRGGIPEVIGDTGRLIDPEDTNQFASAISELLSDPQQCRQLGQAGYDRCRTLFDWRVIAANWTAVLNQISNSEVTIRVHRA
jgi:spore coat protein SA